MDKTIGIESINKIFNLSNKYLSEEELMTIICRCLILERLADKKGSHYASVEHSRLLNENFKSTNHIQVNNIIENEFLPYLNESIEKFNEDKQGERHE